MHLSNNYGHLCLEEIRITFQHSGVLYHRMSPVTEVIVLKYELAYRTLPMRLPCCGSWREVTSVEPSSPFTQTSVCFIFPSLTQLFDQTNTWCHLPRIRADHLPAHPGLLGRSRKH